jgi:hypothetical protein
MKLTGYLAVWLVLASAVSAANPVFDELFTGRTLRLDYFHTGTAEFEHLSLDRARVEGPWPGSRTQLLDDTNLGKYRFEVVDVASNNVIYSRGFASIYGEWETTGEAADGVVRTIPEALRFPEPQQPVQVRLFKRGGDQLFREIWSTPIDPSSRFVHRAAVAKRPVGTILESGDPSTKVDLVILGDGYTANEMEKYHRDAALAAEDLFSHEPFASRQGDFNVWTVDSPAAESGISRPRSDLFRETPLGASYNSFDSERYILSLDDRGWRDVAASTPYDFVLMLVNSEKYGGGGIFNLYSTAAVDSGFRRYLVVHEFGHHFAGLGDEYYTSSVAYEGFHGEQVEPWEPNVTALHDPEHLKWADLVETSTPLPTPWKKEEFEEYSLGYQEKRRDLRRQGAPEGEMEVLFREAQIRFTEMLGSEEYAGRVGAFEGASYQATGLFRPQADCIMFTRDEVGFCHVCSRAIERVIDLYSR